MKCKYKTLITLAAVIFLATVAHAQPAFNPEKYVSFPDEHVGLNKYLKSTEPNADGEYVLRLETFITGSVSKRVVPTDFVLVLDNSGSMLEDCLYGKTRPDYVTETQLADPEDPYYNFLREAHTPDNCHLGIHCYSYNYGYDRGDPMFDVPTTNTSIDRYRMTAWSYFDSTEDSPSPSLYYYIEDDGIYYKIKREEYIDGDVAYYNLFIIRINGQKLYLICTKDGSNFRTELSPEALLSNNNSPNQILLVGYAGDNIYRPLSRVDELLPGVDAFIRSIYYHNTTDRFEAGVTKHQIAIVAFANTMSSGTVANPSIAPSSSGISFRAKSNTRVVKGFAEIGDNNLGSYLSVIDDHFNFRGGTLTFYGLRLATRLLQNLQRQTGMAPVNGEGEVNRNKVVVVFTDGEPKELYANGTYPGGTGGSRFNTVRLSLQEAGLIKSDYSTGTGNSQGTSAKIYTIDFADTMYASEFLKYLSSNYNDSAATGGPNMADIVYSGTAITPEEDRIYYMDARQSGGLESAFADIADATTGDTGAHLVAVDAISDSFDLPDGLESSGKIRLYTSQCIGTKEIDGQTYLAFAEDVPVDSRPPLEEIWFDRVDERGGVSWTKKTNLDIDRDISFVIDDKRLIFNGFDFENLWCGLDGDTDHHNTRQISSNDPNYAFQQDGYRGFKLVAEFPITVAEDAVGGADIPTNATADSGLFISDGEGNPEGEAVANYPEPVLTIPIRLIIQKSGLAEGESASFTIQRKLIDSEDDYSDFTSFILTGTASGSDVPEVRLLSLDPRYHYRIKETGWSWAYERASFLPSTEDRGLTNPIVFENRPADNTPRHAEAKAVNRMSSVGGVEVDDVSDGLLADGAEG